MLDNLIIIIYLLLVLLLGIIKGLKVKSIQEFSIGSRNRSDFVLLSAVFATLIGAATTVGLAKKAFLMGPVFILIACSVSIARAATALYIAPKIIRFAGCLSAAEIMGRLYGQKVRVLTGVATVIATVFVLSAQISAMELLIESTLGIPSFWGVIIGTGLIVIYTTFGGINSVTATDALQFAVILIAIPLIGCLAVSQVGGLSALLESLPESHAVLIPSGHVAAYVFLYALPTIAPVTIQRLLMGSDSRQLKKVFLWTAALNVPYSILVGLIGLVAFALNPLMDANLAMPAIINLIFAPGVKGIMIIGILSVLMSTMDSFLNTAAIAVSNDILPQVFPMKKWWVKHELFFARASSLFIGAGAIVVMLFFKSAMTGVYASLSIWGPYFCPAIFLGILGVELVEKDFWVAFSLSLATAVILALFGYITGFVPTIAAIFVNGTTLLVRRKKSKKTTAKPQLLSRFWLKVHRYFLVSEGVFDPTPFVVFLSGNVVLTFYLAINGCICIYFYTHLAFSASSFFLLTKDYWVSTTRSLYPYVYSLALLAMFPLYTSFQFFQRPAQSLWGLEVVLGILIVSLLLNKYASLLINTIGISAGLLASHYVATEPTVISNSQLVTILAFLYFTYLVSVLYYSHKHDQQEINDIKALSGTLAHALSVPLGAFNSQAASLQQYLPQLIQVYRQAQVESPRNNTISEPMLERLSKLPTNMATHVNRLQDNMASTRRKLHLPQEKRISSKCSLQRCIKLALREYDNIRDQGQEVIFNDNLSDVAFFGNQAEIILVIGELIKNALCAISEAGKGNMTIQINPAGRALLFEDTALGVPLKNIEKLFVRFFTTTNGGTGLGLFHCRVIMEDIGGNIRCESKEGQYTRFILTFPRMETK